MSLSNIDKFNEISGRIFADLYNSFPQPLQITFQDYQASIGQTADPFDQVIQDYF